jgi:hypothetical protein
MRLLAMSRYFFDINAHGEVTTDQIGVEIDRRTIEPQTLIRILADIAKTSVVPVKTSIFREGAGGRRSDRLLGSPCLLIAVE